MNVIKADYRYDSDPSGEVSATSTVHPSGYVGICASEYGQGEYRAVVLHFTPERAMEVAAAIVAAALKAKIDAVG